MLTELLKLYNESRVNPHSPECMFAETLIFNEGWLLRAVLKAWRDQTQSSPFDFLPFPARVHVYSEAQLRTPFRTRFRGDKRGEGHTRVDGIVGHLGSDGTKVGITLSPECKYLAVFEAKMGSALAGETTHIADYDQVSRTAACMIQAILQTRRPEDVAAYLMILYPQHNPHIVPSQYTKTHVERQIARRVSGYLKSTTQGERDTLFFDQWLQALDRIHIQFLTWENVVAEIDDHRLYRFYDLCKQFNLGRTDRL